MPRRTRTARPDACTSSSTAASGVLHVSARRLRRGRRGAEDAGRARSALRRWTRRQSVVRTVPRRPPAPERICSANRVRPSRAPSVGRAPTRRRRLWHASSRGVRAGSPPAHCSRTTGRTSGRRGISKHPILSVRWTRTGRAGSTTSVLRERNPTFRPFGRERDSATGGLSAAMIEHLCRPVGHAVGRHTPPAIYGGLAVDRGGGGVIGRRVVESPDRRERVWVGG